MSLQDPKFNFNDNRIFHAEDNTQIPEDEPVVLLRGKDEVALAAIEYYVHLMKMYPDLRLAIEHAASMSERVEAFKQFQSNNPDRVGMGCHTCDHLTHRVRLPDLVTFSHTEAAVGHD